MFSESRYRVHVCLGPNCVPNGSKRTLAAFEAEVARLGMQREVELIGTSCRSRCELGPSVNVYPGPTLYGFVDEIAAELICLQHLARDEVVDELVVETPNRWMRGRR